MRKALISASAFALVAPLLLAGTASQASAAPAALKTCFADTCTGWPAASYTCVTDAEVIYSLNIMNGSTVVGNVQLKYSPSCRATWARVISNLGFGADAGILSSNGRVQACGVTNIVPGTGCNTNMIDDKDPLTSSAEGHVYLNPGGAVFASRDTPFF